MKKIFAFILAVLISIGAFSACASTDENIYPFIGPYNDFARTVGADELDINNALVAPENQNLYFFQMGEYTVAFELSGKSIKSGFVFTSSDACIPDFLCSCVAMVSFLGEINIPSYGMILYQFCSLRAGIDSIPDKIGKDAFQIIMDENMGYLLVYMNDDLAVND